VQLNWFALVAPDPVGTKEITMLNTLVEKFNAENSDRYELSVEYASTSENSGLYKLGTTVSSKSAPDIVGPIVPFWMAQYKKDWADLSGLMNDAKFDTTDYYPSLLPYYQSGDLGQIGIPLVVYPTVLFYNQWLFNRAGLAAPPHEWEGQYQGGAWDYAALRNAAMRITHDALNRSALNPSFDSSQIDFFGYHAVYSTLLEQWGPMGSAGLLNEQGQVVLPDIWRKAAHWYYDGIWKDFFIPNDNYVQNHHLFYFTNTFYTGNVGMSPYYFWYGHYASGQISHYRFTWDVAALPSFEGNRPVSPLYSYAFAIPKTSQHHSASFGVINLLLTKYLDELLEYFREECILPAQISRQNVFLDKWAKAFPGADPQVVLDALEYVDTKNPYFLLPDYPKALELMMKFQNNYESNGGLDLDAELDQLEKDLQATAS
jgi:multiple sugar transport system substrate-binding protein